MGGHVLKIREGTLCEAGSVMAVAAIHIEDLTARQ
jgi:hypothetical protein